MYSRRIKLNKKKPKATSRQKPAWGPRLALIERERAIASGVAIEDGDGAAGAGAEEEEIYDIQHEFIHSAKRLHGPLGRRPQPPPHGPPPPSNGAAGHQGQRSSRGHNEDPVLRLGSGGGSPNYFYYNYSRRTAPNTSTSAQQRKTSCPEPSSSVHSQQSRMMAERKMPNHHSQQQQQQQQQHRRASYVLGSSSGYCSGSVTTLSTCANNENNSNFSKPLTLIIPSHDGQGHHGGHPNGRDRREYHHQNGMILMKRQVPKGGHHDHNDFGVEDNSLESFPSSSAYQSSGDEEDVASQLLQQRQPLNMNKRPFQNPMAHMNNI